MKKQLAASYLLLSFIALFAMLTAMSACTKDQQPGNPPVYTNNDTTKYYLALGDSYSIGQSVSEDQRFPNQTRGLLFMQNINLAQPTIIATTGWTTGNLLSALNSNPPTRIYDAVSLLIGVNNQYQRRSQAEYRTEFELLLTKSISYAGGNASKVFVLSIPDYSVTPFALNSDTARIAREIDEFNSINKQIAQQYRVTYIDITPISREGRFDPSLQAADGLHPSGKQYMRWAALLAPLMKLVL
jgi:lysophospholipase L1-like esterase